MKKLSEFNKILAALFVFATAQNLFAQLVDGQPKK